jgi:hypothetical protein
MLTAGQKLKQCHLLQNCKICNGGESRHPFHPSWASTTHCTLSHTFAIWPTWGLANHIYIEFQSGIVAGFSTRTLIRFQGIPFRISGLETGSGTVTTASTWVLPSHYSTDSPYLFIYISPTHAISVIDSVIKQNLYDDTVVTLQSGYQQRR